MGGGSINTPADLASRLEAFFTPRLIAQRKVSPHTINSYRDTFRLLLKFAEHQFGCPPSKLPHEHLAAPFVAAFLAQLETSRANSPRTRDLRLAAWVGQRDHAFLLTAVQTGLRISDLTGLRQQDVLLGIGAHDHPSTAIIIAPCLPSQSFHRYAPDDFDAAAMPTRIGGSYRGYARPLAAMCPWPSLLANPRSGSCVRRCSPIRSSYPNTAAIRR